MTLKRGVVKTRSLLSSCKGIATITCGVSLALLASPSWIARAYSSWLSHLQLEAWNSMRNFSSDDSQDTLRRATPIRLAEDTDSHVVGGEASPHVADIGSRRFISHDLNESLDTDTSVDDQEGDGETDALKNSKSSEYYFGVEQDIDSEQEEPHEENSSASKRSASASHDSAGGGEGIAVFKVAEYVISFHHPMKNITLTR